MVFVNIQLEKETACCNRKNNNKIEYGENVHCIDDGSITNDRVTQLVHFSLCLFISPLRSSTSPKPDLTPVSAWSRSASRCSLTSSTLSGARALQTSTAMWHNGGIMVYKAPYPNQPQVKQRTTETILLHIFSGCCCLACSHREGGMKQDYVPPSWKQTKQVTPDSHRNTTPSDPLSDFMLFTSPVPRTVASMKMPIAIRVQSW